MVNLLESRTNCYETLGLTPAAGDGEIREAFKRKISLFRTHPLGAAAQVCIAYETLRDPIKREEHDRLLGIKPEEPRRTTYAVVQPRWTPFIASPRFNPAGQQGSTALPRPPATPEREGNAPVHPRLAAIASSLQELARPIASEAPPRSPIGGLSSAELETRARDNARVYAAAATLPQMPLSASSGGPSNSTQNAQQQRSFEQPPELDRGELVRQIRGTSRAETGNFRDADHLSFAWKRPAVVVGGLLFGAVVFGALAGLSVKEEEGPSVVKSAVLIPPPAPTKDASVATTSSVSIPIPERQKQFPKVADFSSGARHTVSRPKRYAASKNTVPVVPPEQGQTVQSALDQSAGEPAQKVAAILPLPAKVIARTIERIGYSCGNIASTAQVGDQARGVFRVTCTSGQSYDATPLRGRYHFRRVAGG